MTPRQFETYLNEARLIGSRLPSHNEALQDLLKLIATYQEQAKGKGAYEAFFRGEHAYYSKSYEEAIKHYLVATAIPKYQYYCYRASCKLAMERGDLQQALNFANKALRLNQGDPALQLAILELKALKTTQETVSQANEATPEPSKSHRISLGDQEIQALANIFQDNIQQEEELFAREVPSTTSIKAQSSSQAFEKSTPHNYAKESMQSLSTATSSSDNITESTMNTGSDIFSSPKQQEAAAAESLTQRLYALTSTPASPPPNATTQKALEELKRLAIAESKNETFTTSIAREHDGSLELEQCIQSFQKSQSSLMQSYLELTQKRPKILDHALYILHGWNLPAQESSFASQLQFNPSLLTEESRKSSGGHFIRWNGKGIVLNPGAGFIDNFHRQGLSIKDIDFVIVTRDSQEAYADIKKIYELNYQLNKTSSELQIIHFYLNQKAFRDLSSVLKPHFKQARHTIHSLEMFLDSPDVEKVELTQGIVLNYFLATQNSFYRHDESQESMPSRMKSTLGIRLDLSEVDEQGREKPSLRLGYLSGSGWSPLLSHHLGFCDVLLTGFGNTNPNDYTKLSYNEDSLGYHGTYTLLEEVAPRLLLSAEYGGREGDIRIEVLKKMRNEYAERHHSARQTSVILPADIGLLLDFRTLQIKCSVSQAYVEPTRIHVVKSSESFGRLHYLSPSYCI